MKRIALIVSLCLSACNYATYKTPEGGPGGAFGGAPGASEGLGKEVCSTDPALGDGAQVIIYDQVRAEVFEPKCFACHGNGSAAGGVDLSTFASAQPWAPQIKFDVQNNIMPKAPFPPLNASEKDLVAAWVDQGALDEAPTVVNCEMDPPQDGGQGGGDGDTPPDQGGDPQDPPTDEFLTEVPADQDINFLLIREKVFKFRCFACHSTATGNSGGLNLETYANTLDEIDDVEEEVAQGSMPPVWGPTMNDIERQTLLRWIELGAPR